MQTIRTGTVRTRSIAIAASPAEVHSYLADPRALPRWAPEFAEEVRQDGDDWIVTTGGGELRFVVPVHPDAGTVDMLAAADPRSGLFIRIVPNWDGSECVFTMVFPPGTPAAAIAGQMLVIDHELAAIRTHVEATPG